MKHCFEEDFVIRDIPGHPFFQIDELGTVYNKTTGEIVRVQIDERYDYVNLKKKRESIHSLVARTFIENTLNKPYVDHIDGNKKNNRIENLRYVTNQENQQNRKNLMLTNSSGITGVRVKHVTCNSISYPYWIAHIKVGGRSREKNFPYTNEGFEAAVQWRKMMESKHFTVDNNILVYKQ